MCVYIYIKLKYTASKIHLSLKESDFAQELTPFLPRSHVLQEKGTLTSALDYSTSIKITTFLRISDAFSNLHVSKCWPMKREEVIWGLPKKEAQDKGADGALFPLEGTVWMERIELL